MCLPRSVITAIPAAISRALARRRAQDAQNEFPGKRGEIEVPKLLADSMLDNVALKELLSKLVRLPPSTNLSPFSRACSR